MKKLSLAIALAFAAVGAQAATVTSSFSIALSNTEINQTGMLDLFDPNLGTLTGVALTLSAAMESTIKLTLGAASGPQNVKGTAGTDISFNSTVAALQNYFNIPGNNPAISMSVTTGFQTLNPNTEYNAPVLTDSDSLNLVAGPDPSWVGVGTFGLGCTSLSGFALAGGGGWAGGSETRQAGCGASVTYTYRPTPPRVPEPGSLALVGAALAAAGFVSRRKA